MKNFAFPRTLRFRITLLTALLLLVTFALTSVFVLYSVRHAYEETVDLELRARFQAAKETLSETKTRVDWAEVLEDQEALGPAGAWMQISDSKGQFLYRSDALRALPPPQQQSKFSDNGSLRTVRINHRLMRVLTGPFDEAIVQIALPLNEFSEMVEKLEWMFITTLPLILSLAILGGHWLGGRSLKPVEDFEATLARITTSNLSERLIVDGAGDELERLAATANEMLTRLEASFDTIARFTADASHELRTPVAIVQTTGEVILMADRTPDEHQQAWRTVLMQTDRMGRLIEDLLVLARTDCREPETSFEPLDLGTCIADAIRDVRILAETAEITLTATLVTPCIVIGDTDALRRVFLIILENAVKYTPAGGTIEVSMKCNRRGIQETAIVSIRDTGIGIHEQDLPRIFERFYRVSRDRSRRTGGAGLGLSIAQSFILRHNGTISVTSVPLQGSVFDIELPLSNSAVFTESPE
ncbi:sensor histidine kinase [Terriglobus roseus]|uniref:sensor histidine kinase n=1 Tax=Terriglobus roseus TaxID=392734 RepID=UPI001560323C|nr:ATP-binding protein [Terriglobus roseus]